MHESLEEASKAAAVCEDIDDALRIIYDYTGIDDGAFGYDFVEGLRVSGDTTWSELSQTERDFEINHAAAIEVEAMVAYKFPVIGDLNAIRIAARSGYQVPVAYRLATEMQQRMGK
jgi:hypothetical protein